MWEGPFQLWAAPPGRSPDKNRRAKGRRASHLSSWPSSCQELLICLREAATAATAAAALFNSQTNVSSYPSWTRKELLSRNLPGFLEILGLLEHPIKKSKVETSPHTENLIPRLLAGVELFPPCSGPACHRMCSLTTPTYTTLQVVT